MTAAPDAPARPAPARPAPVVRDSMERRDVAEAMTPATRRLADKVAATMKTANTDQVLAHWDIGRELDVAADDVGGEYGSAALAQIGLYLGLGTEGSGKLYALRNFARVFPERHMVEFHTSREFPNGMHLRLEHWTMLATLESPAQRTRELETTIIKGWSTAELKLHLHGSKRRNARRGGGRKHKAPASLPAAFNQMVITANKLCRLEDNFNNHLFAPLDLLPAEQLRAGPLRDRLTEADQMLERLIDRARTWRDKLRPSLAVATEVLAPEPVKALPAAKPAAPKPAPAKPAAAAKPAPKPAAAKPAPKPAAKPAGAKR